MHPLYQRLRELDWDTFQKLAFQLLSAKHPGLELRHVEGAGGDRGLDLFEGRLRDRPTIWQCKHFPNGLGPKQRPQVKASLKTAIKYFKPSQWILVVSVDLDRAGFEWFQKLQKSYAGKTAVGLFQASDIVGELIHRRNIRDAFFPGAVLDTITVARALKGAGDSSPGQLDQLAREQLDELIARLEEADARFNYRITYGPNVGKELAETPPNDPLLVASVTDENKRVDVYARDLEALKLDPPKGNFMIKGSGVAKFQEFLRTGKQQEFGTDEVSNAASTFDFLLGEKQIAAWKLVLRPSQQLRKKVLSLRVTFSGASGRIRYDLVKFRVSSMGMEQVEIESISPLPFVLSFSLPLAAGRALLPGKEADFTIQQRFPGADVRMVSKAIRAIALLRGGGSIELYALEVEKVLGNLSVKNAVAVGEAEWWEDVILDVARVSELFNVDIRVPERITREDLASLTVLIAIGDGKPLPFDGLNAKLVKSVEQDNIVFTSGGKKLKVGLHFPKLDPAPKLFGAEVDTGPISLTAAEASVEDEQEFLGSYKNAKYGDRVPIRIRMKGVTAQRGVAPGTEICITPAEG